MNNKEIERFNESMIKAEWEKETLRWKRKNMVAMVVILLNLKNLSLFVKCIEDIFLRENLFGGVIIMKKKGK